MNQAGRLTEMPLHARLVQRRCAFLLTLFASGAAFAQAGDGREGERPGAGGPPDEITLRAVLLDVDAIDDKAQRFSVDLYYELGWRDPRLAVPGNGEGVRSFPMDDIWHPRLTVINDRGLSLMLPRVADVDGAGNVIVRQRISGELAVDLDLRRFPFDTQQLGLVIVSYRYTPSEVVFSDASVFAGDPATFSADGWQFELQPLQQSVFRVSQARSDRPELTLPLTAGRQASFFVLTLALPMTLILFMAWTVHWLQPAIVPARMSMSTATVFSLIALGVSVRLSLPRVDYLTLADQFVIFSTLLVLLSLGITVIVTRWNHDGREDIARRLTRYARWGFPVIFVLIIARVLTI